MPISLAAAPTTATAADSWIGYGLFAAIPLAIALAFYIGVFRRQSIAGPMRFAPDEPVLKTVDVIPAGMLARYQRISGPVLPRQMLAACTQPAGAL